MKDNNPDKAYASMKKRIDLGKDLIYSLELVKFYKYAMLSKHSEKAARICDELFQILIKNTDAVPEDVELYAKRLELKEKSVEAILFFQIACSFYQKTSNGIKGVNGMTICCEGTKNI